MIVVTEKGFVHLSGCYQVIVFQTDFSIEPRWNVNAVWALGNGEATLYKTDSEADAHRTARAIEEVAWGESSDTERRIDLKDLIGKR